MPTRHPRHTLTETGEVADALGLARGLLPDMTDSERLRRLLICGAEALSAHASAEQRERRRARQMGLLTAGGLSSDELVLVLKDVLDEPGEDA